MGNLKFHTIEKTVLKPRESPMFWNGVLMGKRKKDLRKSLYVLHPCPIFIWVKSDSYNHQSKFCKNGVRLQGMVGSHKSFCLIEYLWKGGSTNSAQFALFIIGLLWLIYVKSQSFSDSGFWSSLLPMPSSRGCCLFSGSGVPDSRSQQAPAQGPS